MLETSKAVAIVLVFAVLVQFLVDRIKDIVGEKVMGYVKAPGLGGPGGGSCSRSCSSWMCSPCSAIQPSCPCWPTSLPGLFCPQALRPSMS